MSHQNTGSHGTSGSSHNGSGSSRNTSGGSDNTSGGSRDGSGGSDNTSGSWSQNDCHAPAFDYVFGPPPPVPEQPEPYTSSDSDVPIFPVACMFSPNVAPIETHDIHLSPYVR